MIKRRAENGKLSLRKKFRRGKRRNENLTAQSDTFDLGSTIRKMKIPLLVLCLTVICGTYRIYAEENVNLIEDITNDDRNYDSDFPDVPLEASFSRHRRALGLISPIKDIGLNILGKTVPPIKDVGLDVLGKGISPIKDIGLDVLGKGISPIKDIGLNVLGKGISPIKDIGLNVLGKGISPIKDIGLNVLGKGISPIKDIGLNILGKGISPIKDIALQILGKSFGGAVGTVLDLCDFAYGALIGQNVCPDVELSLDLIKQGMKQPIQTTKSILCYTLNLIGSTGRAIVSRLFNVFSQFVRRTLLPQVHTMLNIANKSKYMPPSIKALIVMFNTAYAIAKLMGYVG